MNFFLQRIQISKKKLFTFLFLVGARGVGRGGGAGVFFFGLEGVGDWSK